MEHVAEGDVSVCYIVDQCELLVIPAMNEEKNKPPWYILIDQNAPGEGGLFVASYIASILKRYLFFLP